ncbi:MULTISPECIES: hypothetical protein [unclassified Sporosarcina]|uniref:hypothetical protein n=1 Tax=unclassified Sporosarcina TaxID=2647733 RepID=UPI0020412F3D|nr:MULTISPECIES: hypothetical protein [unclassified Sporosarcina]GKV64297.1 sporulation integral membrane protein YlbJ [Sporosarcina sp. NCCP-2331]GLB54239.1 sporulation integral membrane protein YlbJ [Sporosarcina sp. NCCP-2378]
MINVTVIWALIILFIIQPEVAHEGAVSGAQLFVHALLPYLLPYIILTQWLLKMPGQQSASQWKRYIKAYVLGSFGGFPVGAVTVSEMKKNGEISTAESSLLLASCHAPGPMFIIGFVGNELLGSVVNGWKLLLAIHLANIVFFLMMMWLLRKQRIEHVVPPAVKDEQQNSSPLLSSIKDSSSVILLVATTVIFFSSMGNVLSSLISTVFPVDMGGTKTILLAIFEMTSGVQSATEHFSGDSFYPLLIAAIISLNGMSIHMQVMTIAKSAGIRILPYVIGRAWNTLLVPLLFFWMY